MAYSPLDPKPEHAETVQLYGAKIVRWTDHKNADGSRTIVIMVRDTLPQTEYDPDGFDVFMETQGNLKPLDRVSANAFAFSKNSNEGVSGLFWCQWNSIYNEWIWFEKDWVLSTQ